MISQGANKRLPTITMVGTAMEAQGGIAAVVTSLVSGGLADLYAIDYVETHTSGSSLRKLLVATRAWFALFVRLILGRLNLLHVHVSSRASFWRKYLLVLPALLANKPVVLHVHSGGFKQFYEHETSNFGKRVIRHLFEASERVVVLSDGWKRWVESVFPHAKVRVIYNPAPDVESVSTARESDSLLFLGRLGSMKGTGDLLRAVASLSPELRPRVILGGDGDIAGMKSLAKQLGIHDRVEFLGWVSGQEKKRLLLVSTAFVLPSYSEGLPMGLLEAMGYGMPVVTTPVGGIPEAVTDGVEGFLVEPGDVGALADRLARLLRDSGLREKMGAAGVRKVAGVFAMDRIVPKWVELYSELGVMPARDPVASVR